jgi:hypothetical protein
MFRDSDMSPKGDASGADAEENADAVAGSAGGSSSGGGGGGSSSSSDPASTAVSVGGGTSAAAAAATQPSRGASGSGGASGSTFGGATGASTGSSGVAASSRSTDVYALGTLLWEVLTGTAPWRGHTEASRLADLRVGRGLDLALLPLATPPSVRDLVARCLAADRAKRPRMAEVRATLERELLLAQSGRFDVFISHAWGARSRRKPFTDAVYAALRAEGFSVWLDSIHMGHDLQTSMRAGVAASEAVLVLVSPDYAASANCMFELREAAAAGKSLVAALVEPGFWTAWQLPGGAARAVPDDHELVALARLRTHLFADLGEASKADWRADVADEDRAKLAALPEALPRLRELLRAALRGKAAGAAALQRRSAGPAAGTW